MGGGGGGVGQMHDPQQPQLHEPAQPPPQQLRGMHMPELLLRPGSSGWSQGAAEVARFSCCCSSQQAARAESSSIAAACTRDNATGISPPLLTTTHLSNHLIRRRTICTAIAVMQRHARGQAPVPLCDTHVAAFCLVFLGLFFETAFHFNPLHQSSGTFLPLLCCSCCCSLLQLATHAQAAAAC